MSVSMISVCRTVAIAIAMARQAVFFQEEKSMRMNSPIRPTEVGRWAVREAVVAVGPGGVRLSQIALAAVPCGERQHRDGHGRSRD